MFSQGAKVKKTVSTIEVAAQTSAQRRNADRHPDAYQLAKENKRKSWAKRWLKANNHWA